MFAIADFKPNLKCQKTVQKAQRALRQLRRTVGCLGPKILLPLFQTYVRPHLGYSIQACRPHLLGDKNSGMGKAFLQAGLEGLDTGCMSEG